MAVGQRWLLFSLHLLVSMRGYVAVLQSCTDESMLSKNGKFSKSDVNELISADNSEQIKICLTVLGKDPLEVEIAELLWKNLVNIYKVADDIPEDELQLMGWIATGIPARDFANLSLTDIETIASFGKWRNFSKEQLMSLKQAIEYQWSYKGPSDLSCYDLAALGQVLCVFNTSQIAAINPLAYKDAASDISKLVNCPEEIIREFATLAIKKNAFGDPSEWTAIQVASIGCVIAGLDSVRDIHADAFEGLAASNIKCLPSQTLQVNDQNVMQPFLHHVQQAMSIEQLSHLSVSAVNALSYAQRSSLDREQLKTIERTTANTLNSVLDNGCSKCHAPLYTAVKMIIIMLMTHLK